MQSPLKKHGKSTARSALQGASLEKHDDARMTKRAVDFVLALVGLLLLWPLFVLVALLIKLDSEGPVFFR
jgi:lipopolysaccharide/colanic/teichoic acid biosynthesis glycosyltransferase